MSQYRISARGVWTRLIPETVPADGAYALVASPHAPYVYLTDFNNNTVSPYRIGVHGSLTAEAQVPTGLDPVSLLADPAAPYLYVANSGTDTISGYRIGAHGALRLLDHSFPAGRYPAALAIAQ